MLGESTCRVWLLTVEDQRYIVRERLDGDITLAQKEAYISDLLRDKGVLSAEVLAVVDNEHGVATLTKWLDGIRLDEALTSLSMTDAKRVWHSTGAILRQAHEIALSEAGEIVGTEIEPFPGGWAQWVLEDTVEDILWLQAKLNSPRVDQSLVERVLVAAKATLTDAPVCLIHNDALPQNILVAQGATGWNCVGWIDWEFARAGDPHWDLATLDFRPADLVPADFHVGYGWEPPEPQASIYELLMAIWRTRAELEHETHWTWPPQAARIGYLQRLPEQIVRLSLLLGVR